MEKMNDLRKGKSAVMEWNHTVLIGWTDRSIAFIAQICLANESGGGGCIVVLAEHGKEAMEAELASSMSSKDLMGTRVVFRSGSPLNALDLNRAACQTARSVVIMAAGDTHSKADAATLRVIIALKTFAKMKGHVVVEVLDKEMEHLMKVNRGRCIVNVICCYLTVSIVSIM
jgi:ion channel POLLUX/CASTOR